MAPVAFDLIETMRWEPPSGFLRLERHLARLHASAHELGFVHDSRRIDEALDRAVGDAAAPLRARLTLSRDGAAAPGGLPRAARAEVQGAPTLAVNFDDQR